MRQAFFTGTSSADRYDSKDASSGLQKMKATPTSRLAPPASQLNAWVSEQSRPLEDITVLERRRVRKSQELGLTAQSADGIEPPDDVCVPRPSFWGGYRFWFSAVELWQEGDDRYHDRLRYERKLTPKEQTAFEAGPWTWQRLQP